MKLIFKIGVISIGSVILFIAFYFVAAFVLSRIGVNKDVEEKDDVTIYIMSNGVHVDIVVPVKTEEIDWSKKIRFENTQGNDSSAEFLALGWGDKGFYLETPTWGDLKFSTAFKAAFALSTSAIHATFYKELKQSDSCKAIKISKTNYRHLIDYIKASFKIDSYGNPIWIKTDANYSKTDAFYEGIGRYNLFYTCNTWANDALKSCGQKACLWTPFDSGIFYQYQEY